MNNESDRKRNLNSPAVDGRLQRDPASREIAVALQYESGSTPTVSVVGRRDVASMMKSVARRYGVSIYRHPALAERLAAVGEDEAIPEDLYRPVAELLYELDEE